MRVPADKILPFLLLMPATGVLAGWLMLGEALSAGLLAGGAIIIVGLAIILWPRKADTPALATAERSRRLEDGSAFHRRSIRASGPSRGARRSATAVAQ